MRSRTKAQYKAMYDEIVKTAKDDINKVGEVVVIKYGLTAKKYSDYILSSYNTNTQSDDNYTILSQMIRVVQDFEKNILIELPIIEKVMDAYVKSSYLTYDDFCEANMLSKEVVLRSREIIRIYDKKKNDFINKEEKIKEMIRKQQLSEQINKVIYLLKNDISLEDGQTRNFDLIDYYKYINIEPIKLISMINGKAIKDKLNTTDLIYLKRFLFIQKNSTLSNYPINIVAKLSSKEEYDCLKDENGKLIPGTGKIITEEQKIALIEYLKQNKIPLIEGTYNAGIKRIKNNTFEIMEKNIDDESNKSLSLLYK